MQIKSKAVDLIELDDMLQLLQFVRVEKFNSCVLIITQWIAVGQVSREGYGPDDISGLEVTKCM